MSSETHTAETPTDITPWDDLTDARRRVAKTIAYLEGPARFNRPDLSTEAEDEDDLELVVDDVDRVLTSLDSTTLLNELVGDGYLDHLYQGGEKPILLDLEFDEDRDQRSVAPYGDTPALHTVKSQILDREGLTEAALEDVEEDDFNALREAINYAVGRTVLVTVSEPSEYRFTEEGYSIVSDRIRT